MRLLLDTCTFLWAAGSPGRLSEGAREAIRSPGHDVWLSTVSAWEVAVKHALGRLPLPDRPSVWLPEARHRHGVESLELGEEAALILERLPPLHRDPFDRMIVCQAIAGGLTIVTPDPEVRAYPVPTLW